MPRPTELHALVRFGQRDHLEAFRTKGQLYMNTLQYFKDLEADVLRGDKGEGLSASFAASKVQFHYQHDGEWHPIEGLTEQIRVHNERSDDRNVFCLYAITDHSVDSFFDARVLSFGDTAVLILDGSEFLRRVGLALTARGWPHGHNLVEYVPKDEYVGPMGAFRKYADFEYQSEFRIVADTRMKKPIDDFFIGDITDITVVHRSDEIRSKLRIQKA